MCARAKCVRAAPGLPRPPDLSLRSCSRSGRSRAGRDPVRRPREEVVRRASGKFGSPRPPRGRAGQKVTGGLNQSQQKCSRSSQTLSLPGRGPGTSLRPSSLAAQLNRLEMFPTGLFSTSRMGLRADSPGGLLSSPQWAAHQGPKKPEPLRRPPCSPPSFLDGLFTLRAGAGRLRWGTTLFSWVPQLPLSGHPACIWWSQSPVPGKTSVPGRG